MKLKRRISLVVLCLLLIFTHASYNANAMQEQVYLGGMTAGFTLETCGARVIGLSNVVTENAITSPAKQAGIEVGDIILKIDNEEIGGKNTINSVLAKLNKEYVIVQYQRLDVVSMVEVKLSKDSANNYKLGVFIRDNLNGVGTISYITKNGEFGSLGHPVIDENNKLMSVTGGDIYNCSVIGVIKGQRGKAGELKGIFIEDKKLGTILQNTEYGIFGKLQIASLMTKPNLIDIGSATVGEAKILTCVDGVSPKEYSINLVKIDKGNSQNKNIVLQITDKNLLKVTNGILQGMSGSPIVQNGKLVGAVTHVFINDPSRGYGILINNMLSVTENMK